MFKFHQLNSYILNFTKENILEMYNSIQILFLQYFIAFVGASRQENLSLRFLTK